MSVIKQYVVMRRDLQMPPGLAAAQAAHLSSLWLYSRFPDDPLSSRRLREPKAGYVSIDGDVTEIEYLWMSKPTLTVCAVWTTEEIIEVGNACEALKIPIFKWEDTIHSEILNRHLQCFVGIATGPGDDELLKQVFSQLPLY